MDQSKSSEIKKNVAEILPKKSLSIEFAVGIFALVGILAAGYLAVGLGEFRLLPSSDYEIFAEFDNVSGLKSGASVEIAGVQVGTVTALNLKDPMALITLRLNRNIKIKDDDIASIRTKGIIGDRYVKISRGASDKFIPEGGVMVDTESVVDIEDVIGKLVHSLTGDKDKTEKTTKE